MFVTNGQRSNTLTVAVRVSKGTSGEMFNLLKYTFFLIGVKMRKGERIFCDRGCSLQLPTFPGLIGDPVINSSGMPESLSGTEESVPYN